MISHEGYLIAQIALWLVSGFGLFCFGRLIFVRNLGEDAIVGLVLGGIFLGLGVGAGATAMLFNTDYSSKITDQYNPDEVELMYDRYEVVIKYGDDGRFEITDKRDYERVMDSCFYIEEKKYFDIFGGEELVEYELITFDDNKDEGGPVKIEL